MGTPDSLQLNNLPNENNPLAKNRTLYNRHANQRCFILATGPSINQQDMAPLKNEICFGLSNFYRHPQSHLVSPQYYCIAPYHKPATEEHWYDWLKKVEKGTACAAMFFGLSDYRRNQRNGLFSNRKRYFLDLSGSWKDALHQEIDLTRPIPETISGSVIPLMIAIYMGFQQIYLLGCDMSWIFRYFGKDMHFFEEGTYSDTQGAGFTECYEESVEYELFCCSRQLQQYRALYTIAKRKGLEIYNAAPGGLVDVFPRVDYDTIFLNKSHGHARSINTFSPMDAVQTTEPYHIVAWNKLTNIKSFAEQNRFGNYEVVFQGHTFFCHDLLSFYMAAKDIFLNQIYMFFSEIPNPVVIDGGGHIGISTIFIKSQYPDAKVTVFEPDKNAAALLRKNLAVNNIKDVDVVEAGLYKKDGEISFSADNSDGGSIFGETKNSTIKVVPLSRYITGPVDFLKLNIEGAELDVLTEIEPKLHLIKRMAVEYHGFPEIGQNLHKILTILDRNSFRYLIHDFDAETNSASKPPFKFTRESRFFQLIFAKPLLETQVDAQSEKATAKAHFAMEPKSRQFGFDRGTPIDRYYIENFLKANSTFIRGDVLEFGDNTYTRKFGTHVRTSTILNGEGGTGTPLRGDLATGENIPEAAFDCIIMTQTLQMIYDVKSALKNALAALKPGGTLLLSASGISQISRYDMDRWGEYWRFTDKSMSHLLTELAPSAKIVIQAHGNVAVAKAFLDGMAAHEIPDTVLVHPDNDYQVVVTARVATPGPESAPEKAAKPLKGNPPVMNTPLVLLYHRVAHDPVDAQLLAVNPDNFEAHLKHLADHFRVLSLADLCRELRQNILSPDTIALTFDDGYLDNLTNAVPLLEKYGLHATLFITSGMVGADHEFWWDAMERIFFRTPMLPPILGIHHDGAPHQWDIATPSGRLKAHDDICDILRNQSAVQIDQFIRPLISWAGLSDSAPESHKTINDLQLKALAASPVVDIGSHTVTHSRLTSLPLTQQQMEIAESKARLEGVIGKSVQFFSYPFGNRGDFTRETAALVVEAGYAAGIANIQGNITSPVEMYAVPRRLVRDWPDAVFTKWLADKNKDALEVETVQTRAQKLRRGRTPV